MTPRSVPTLFAVSLVVLTGASARADKLAATPAAGQAQKAGDIQITLTDMSSAGEWIDASLTLQNTGMMPFALKPATQFAAKDGSGATLEQKDLLTLGGKGGEVTVNPGLRRVGHMKWKAANGGAVTISFQPTPMATVTWTVTLPASAPAAAAAPAPAPASAPMENRPPPAAPSPAPGAPRQLYKVGDRGPAGGTIFFDKGNDSDGWRFLELASADASEGATWSNGPNLDIKTATAVGSGKANTAAIIAAQGPGAYAAKLCADANGGGVTDWFLPSKDELDLAWKALGKSGAFSFAPYAKKEYWTSSQMNNHLTHIQSFGDGTQTYQARINKLRVRAIRAF